MPLRWSQSLGEEPGCSWGGARAWGRSLGVPGVEPEIGGGAWVFLGWSQRLGEEPGCSWGGARAWARQRSDPPWLCYFESIASLLLASL